jgi:type IV pilus assembly protein PilO
MSMDLSAINNLDIKNVAQAPMGVKAMVLALLFLAIAALGYYFDWSGGLNELEGARAEERSLRETYLTKKRQAINYTAYKARYRETEQGLAAMVRQLPNKSEIDALLTDVNQAGVSRGLEFDLFRPNPEIFADFYAILPVTIKVNGGYHDLAYFASDVAKLPRIVTIHDIQLTPGSGGRLTMDASIRTYRYLSDEEVAAAKKKAKEEKK